MIKRAPKTLSPIIGLTDSVFARLRCPEDECGGALVSLGVGRDGLAGERHGFLACRRCHAHYPVLMGVPILVPSPQAYVASHRESLLATLAEFGEAEATSVTLVQELSLLGPMLRPESFADDWVRNETERHWPTPPATAAFVGHAFTAFLAQADRHRPETLVPSWLLQALPRKPKFVVDVGCGVGTIARALLPVAEEVLLADQSLRAVCTAQRTARAAGFDSPSGVVCDAASLPLRPRCADAVVGAHVLDVMTDPAAFLRGAQETVRKHGVVLLSTPDPTLGMGEDVLADLLDSCGLAILKRDTIPWLRVHGDRHYEVYFSELLSARPVTA